MRKIVLLIVIISIFSIIPELAQAHEGQTSVIIYTPDDAYPGENHTFRLELYYFHNATDGYRILEVEQIDLRFEWNDWSGYDNNSISIFPDVNLSSGDSETFIWNNVTIPDILQSNQTKYSITFTLVGQEYVYIGNMYLFIDYWEGFTATYSGNLNLIDFDSDLDGVYNRVDAFPNDANETTDSDGDGVGDNSDMFPQDANETIDTDGDGVGDNSDIFPNDANESSDTDGDGIGDNADVFPFDATETQDSDGDGIGDNSDAYPDDYDNDGYSDIDDIFPTDPEEWIDSDGDGIGNNADPDDDNDGVYDADDPEPYNSEIDGTENYWMYVTIIALAIGLIISSIYLFIIRKK